MAEEEAKKDAEEAEAKKNRMPYYRGRVYSPETYRDYLPTVCGCI